MFCCTRTVAEAIVAEQQRLRETVRERYTADGKSGPDLAHAVDEALPPMWFDGDEIVYDESATFGYSRLTRCSPDTDGRYVVQGRSWTWSAVDPTDCDRIVGDIPPQGRQQEFVMAEHSPLRMPHDRLQITAIQVLLTDNTVAYSATLCLDGKEVATIDNDGRGGGPRLHPSTVEFGLDQAVAFADQCRWQGRRIYQNDVLEALVIDYLITDEIRAAAAEEMTAIRLVDLEEHTVDLGHRVEPQQLTRGMHAVAEQLTAATAAAFPHLARFTWLYWTGDRWAVLGIVEAPQT